MKINNRGFGETTDHTGHRFDETLANGILQFLKVNNINSVFDFGCGMGDYSKLLIKNNIMSEAYDGNPNTPELTDGIGKVLDLSKYFDLNKKNDCVIVLEVGEHIPKKFESVFIDNIIRHTDKYILLSGAIPGQSGDGHVNCQTNVYISNIFSNLGFRLSDKTTYFFRENSELSGFKNTILFFYKEEVK